MNAIIKKFGRFATLFVGLAWMLSACDENSYFINAEDARQDPVLNSSTLKPLTNESGTVAAYIGTEVSIAGFNLDHVSAVTFDDQPAEITEQTIKSLKFRIPALDLAQDDLPYVVRLKAYDEAGEQIFNYPYFVTIPVVDAIVEGYTPTEGTLGTEITISGRNLEQVTRVHFGNEVVEASAFTSIQEGSKGSHVKFAVPVGNYAAGNSEITITAEWAQGTLEVTGEAPFTLHTPRFEAVTQSETSLIGDEVTLTGENLGLVSAVLWGDTELIILDEGRTEETMTVKFPSSIPAADPAVVTAALKARWGEPAQLYTIAEAWSVDTTPKGPAKPVVMSMTVEDGKYYLGKKVTVKGENLSSLEGFTVDGVAAALIGEPTDIEAQFVIPEGVTFTEAKEVAILALYDGGNTVECGTETVYPFYFYKGIRLGLGSNSKSTYTEFASQNAFFYPDLGRVVSTSEWMTTPLDPYAASGSNSAISAANTLNKSNITEAQYYDVMPYFFFICNSSNKLSLAGCANSNSQLKTHCTFDGGTATSLPSAFGTPIMQYRVVTGDTATPIKEGTLTTMAYTGSVPSAGAPALAASESTSTWVKGSVLVGVYANYAKGAKPASMSDVAKTCYIVIRDITCANLETGAANADRAGYIEVDVYWSKFQNK